MLEKKRVRKLVCAITVISTLSLMSCSKNAEVTESNVIAEGTDAYVTEVVEVTTEPVETKITGVTTATTTEVPTTEVTTTSEVITTSEVTTLAEAITEAPIVSEVAEEEIETQSEEIADDDSYVAEVMNVNGPQDNHLTIKDGRFDGPSGEETFYNLDMSGCISYMRDLGYDSENYSYWERSDGCKMFGPYIMVAANLDIRPKGTVIETSLGTGMVCDTGTFASYNPYQLDIAVTWVV